MIERERENLMVREDEKEKNLIENGPGSRCRISGLPAARENGKTFQLSMFFLRRVFSRCNKLNVTHIPGARFSITLCFPPVFHGSPFAFHPARERVYAWQIVFLSPRSIRCPLLSKIKKKFFFSSTLAKFCVVTLGP